MPVSWSWDIAHDAVVAAAGPGAAGTGAAPQTAQFGVALAKSEQINTAAHSGCWRVGVLGPGRYR